MKIMVVGGAGYIGSRLTPALQERGHDVTVVDLLWFGRHLPEETRVIQKDAMALTEADLKGFNQVVFLGGLSNDPMAEYSPARNFIFNAAAPAYLGYIAKRAGVTRFIYASSCSVYGYTKNEMSTESAVISPAYPYGISKLQGEQALLLMQDSSFSVISLRKGTVSGHSPRMRFDLVVNTMFRSAMVNGEIVVNNPSIWRPIVSIQDAVSSYVRATEADASISGIFNIISGNYIIGQVGDIVKADLERLTGKKIKLTIKNIQDFRNYKVDHHKSAQVLGFQAQTNINDIVNELHAHRAEYGDFQDPLYFNIQTLKALDAQAAAANAR